MAHRPDPQADGVQGRLAGTYSATFNFPFWINDPVFTTNAASEVITAGFFDIDGNNTDNLGPGSPWLAGNELITSIGTFLAWGASSEGPANPELWTSRATGTAVPEPATLFLLGSGMAAAALRRRMRR